MKLICGLLLYTSVFLILSCDKVTNTKPSTQFNERLIYRAVTDIDRNQYRTIQVGDQVWMAENLRTTRYANGDSIPNIQNAQEWSFLKTGAWAHYKNDASYESVYGKYYNWCVSADPRHVCMTGWHVPTDAEWMELLNFLGGIEVAAPKMKSSWENQWVGSIDEISNSSGLSILPAGKRGLSGDFNLMTHRAPFWTTQSNSSNPEWGLSYELFWNSDQVGRFNADDKYYGHCIRCIQD